MAKMIPSEMPRDILNDPRRSAEIRVYEALRLQLPDTFTVFYSRPWRSRLPNGRTIDGEADFVVASADFGILVIEVKGGLVSRDGLSDVWSSTDRNGTTYEITNPVLQARKSKYVLLDRLKRFPWFEERFFNLGYGVILPDCGQPSFELGIEMPPELFAWAEHMDGLVKRLLRILWPANKGDSAHYDPIGEEGVRILHELLARSFQLELRFGSFLGPGRRRIVDLTANQFWVLDGLDRNAKVAVSGGAGTGKTVLAFEKASRMARHGARALFLCFNKGLAETLNQVVGDARHLWVRTFHSFAGSVCQQAGLNLGEPTESERTNFYSETLPNALLEALDARPDVRFDAIIVDEAQDFEENWWLPIQLMLRDSSKSALYVFYDDNQNIYRRGVPFFNDFPAQFQLTRNLRNATSVFESFASYYKGPHYEAGTNLLGEVSFHPEIKASSSLISFVKFLVVDEHIPPSEIVVLTCTTITASLFGLQQVAETLVENFKYKGIRIESIWRFKGQESLVIVLVDLQSALSNREILYTALSRAQLRLCVAGFPGPMPTFP